MIDFNSYYESVGVVVCCESDSSPVFYVFYDYELDSFLDSLFENHIPYYLYLFDGERFKIDSSVCWKPYTEFCYLIFNRRGDLTFTDSASSLVAITSALSDLDYCFDIFRFSDDGSSLNLVGYAEFSL